MPSPFLVIRFVFMALLVYLGVIVLVFASWNINAAVSSGLMVPGATIMLIFNSCCLFILVAFAFAELIYPLSRFADLRFECAWTCVMSMFQIGTSIGFSLTGAFYSCSGSKWSLCASTSLLIPTVWINSIITLAYFLTLSTCVAVHARDIPDVWSKTVYTLDWFGDSQNPGKLGVKPGVEPDSWSLYLDNIEATGARKLRYPLCDTEKAPWAEPINLKRGVDQPFAKRDDETTTTSSYFRSNASLPKPPVKAELKEKQSANSLGSRFVERFRESQTISRSNSPFPPGVHDDDQPIPLPRLSQWVKADSGVDCHTVPRSP